MKFNDHVSKFWGAILAPLFLCSWLFATAPYIIVPGTWASQENWYRLGGNFFNGLQASTQASATEVIAFAWSGKNNHQARMHAAKRLAQLIEEYDNVNLVCHSHGANVAILASQFITKGHINFFFALGAPINSDDYFPNMQSINYLIHIFSFADIVQPVLGCFERVYPAHERIANVSITINGIEPSHTELHAPLLASGIAYVQENIDMLLKHPMILHLSDADTPHFEIDYERDTALAADAYYQQQLLLEFGRSAHDELIESYEW